MGEKKTRASGAVPNELLALRMMMTKAAQNLSDAFACAGDSAVAGAIGSTTVREVWNEIEAAERSVERVLSMLEATWPTVTRNT
jgi:hypothetical protein